MLKRLPFLCAALLALAACSHDSDTGSATQQPTSPTPASTVEHASGAQQRHRSSGCRQQHQRQRGYRGGGRPPRRHAAPAPAATAFVDDGKWVEGKQYQRIEPAQPKVTNTSKIEVVEVFSYGCPACNQYHATGQQAGARTARPTPRWRICRPRSCRRKTGPMLQRAYLHRAGAGRGRQGQRRDVRRGLENRAN